MTNLPVFLSYRKPLSSAFGYTSIFTNDTVLMEQHALQDTKQPFCSNYKPSLLQVLG